jgi:hypothetical protein
MYVDIQYCISGGFLTPVARGSVPVVRVKFLVDALSLRQGFT